MKEGKKASIEQKIEKLEEIYSRRRGNKTTIGDVVKDYYLGQPPPPLSTRAIAKVFTNDLHEAGYEWVVIQSQVSQVFLPKAGLLEESTNRSARMRIARQNYSDEKQRDMARREAEARLNKERKSLVEEAEKQGIIRELELTNALRAEILKRRYLSEQTVSRKELASDPSIRILCNEAHIKNSVPVIRYQENEGITYIKTRLAGDALPRRKLGGWIIIKNFHDEYLILVKEHSENGAKRILAKRYGIGLSTVEHRLNRYTQMVWKDQDENKNGI